MCAEVHIIITSNVGDKKLSVPTLNVNSPIINSDNTTSYQLCMEATL